MTDPQRKLGRYELLRRLATGGMGEIYIARTRGAGGFEKLVIIKTILPHLAEQEEFVTKFLDEGRTVVQLTHGNIVPVFDMGEQDGEYFIAMEYVPGLDLRAVIKRLAARGEELPIELALYITCEICKGLGYAHRKVDDNGNPLNIVHRDVSPSNVLISREGEVKIIDFGIARATGKVAQTASGRIQGKCCYMSPEQARGQNLDARSDIFSTGLLLYEMLTLTRPFEGRSDLESLELVRQCDLDPPGVLRASIPQEVDDIVCRAMAQDPDDRYPTSDDLLVDLQHEMYRLGQTPTSQRLVEALSDVFADDAAEQLGDGSISPPANLDEALELELARLGDDPSTPSHSSLGLAATLPSPSGGTRTLSSTPIDRPSGRNTSETDSESGSAPPVTGSDAQTGPTTGSSSHIIDASNAIRRRHLATIIAVLVVAISGFAIFSFMQTEEEAVLELATEPADAQIYLDGEELVGRRTPDTLTLAPGSYSVELTLEDHRPREFRVNLDPGEIHIIDAEELVLTPVQSPTRTFTITTEPEDAIVSADGDPIGPGPHELDVVPDEVINLAARAPGCSTAYYTLSHGNQRRDVHIDLQCDSGQDDDEEVVVDEEPELRADASDRRQPPNAVRSIRIDSEPQGAEIVVNDKVIGTSPVYTDLPSNRRAVFEARHEGFEPIRTTHSLADLPNGQLTLSLKPRPKGCLTFRAVYPANNEIAINGTWLDGRFATLQNHPLPAGQNTITVRHPESEREESFDVDIEAGDDCEVLTVWERE